jgi:hypothetical protein
MKPTAFCVESLTELKPGNHVSWPIRRGAYHHAIVIEVVMVGGQDLMIAVRVIHYYSDGFLNMESATVREDLMFDLDRYVACDELRRHLYEVDSCHCPKNVGLLVRARSRLGESEYHPLNNNCEHFVNWCQTGDDRSRQVEYVPIPVAMVHAAMDVGRLLLGGLIGGAAYLARR